MKNERVRGLIKHHKHKTDENGEQPAAEDYQIRTEASVIGGELAQSNFSYQEENEAPLESFESDEEKPSAMLQEENGEREINK